MGIKLRTIGASVMTFFVALVPVFKSCPPCPICMPKYAALFALFGLELADYSHYLIPLMLISMAVSLGSMAQETLRKKISCYPFVLALLSSLMLLFSKYLFESSLATYGMMVALFVAMAWYYRLLGKNCCKSSCNY